MQLIPPIDVFEKVVVLLLKKAGVPGAEVASCAGEDMVKKIAAVHVHEELKSFQHSDVPPGATQKAIDGAVCLSGWFKRMYQLSVDAEREVAAFRDARLKLVSPLPTASVDRVMAYMAGAKGQCAKPAQL